jgi:hypothetical protein
LTVLPCTSDADTLNLEFCRIDVGNYEGSTCEKSLPVTSCPNGYSSVVLTAVCCDDGGHIAVNDTIVDDEPACDHSNCGTNNGACARCVSLSSDVTNLFFCRL